mmetsp:Transcript_102802/g.257917  ORF Transcript_102802/g.257917 Transcript_102802/m.257917 type:complete len:204 (+) Transcript_102802:65-676(+)
MTWRCNRGTCGDSRKVILVLTLYSFSSTALGDKLLRGSSAAPDVALAQSRHNAGAGDGGGERRRVKGIVRDVEAVRARSIQGLKAYFSAVSLTGLDRAAKLEAIAEKFSKDAELIRPDGVILHGRDGVKSFYGSPKSPVMQLPDFAPTPVEQTMSYSPDGSTIAVEIDLPLSGNRSSLVGDFFTFDDEGLIKRMRVYSYPLPP